jgi:hypothetical protein
VNSAPSLRGTIEAACSDTGSSLSDLTVMSGQTDPYRIDTPANRRDAEWLAQAWETCGARRPIHVRGLHYAIVSTPEVAAMPSGEPYLNLFDCWTWLQAVANKARWLRIIRFEDITDERNSAPKIYTEYVDEMDAGISLQDGRASLRLPTSLAHIMPTAEVALAQARQAYKLVFIGEKQSLADVLEPIARQYRADLVLPTGELSTTLLYGIAERAWKDGRPCRIFYFADFDPTGFHMPIEVSRKLQALVDDRFPELDVQVRRCALTADQVQALGLPSTPMKETERRADKWRERFGVEQTEIDALATLRPHLLAQIVEEAVAPYWDETLDERHIEAMQDAQREAQQVLAAIIEAKQDQLDAVEAVLAEARAATERAEAAIAPVLDEIRIEATVAFDEIDLEVPEADPEGDIDEPLFCSTRDWVEQTKILRGEKL